jgi:hypothetical protein
MKIPANHQNPSKISNPDKVEREVVFLRLRNMTRLCACSDALGYLGKQEVTR